MMITEHLRKASVLRPLGLLFYVKTCTKNTILHVTLHTRKVTTEETKQLERTRVTPSYKATVVLR